MFVWYVAIVIYFFLPLQVETEVGEENIDEIEDTLRNLENHSSILCEGSADLGRMISRIMLWEQRAHSPLSFM